MNKRSRTPAKSFVGAVFAVWLAPTSAMQLDTVPGEWETFGGVSFGCNGDVEVMAEAASGLIYIGGNFTVCDAVAASGIVAFDPDNNLFVPLENGVSGRVDAIKAIGNDVYVGGAFTGAGGQAINRLARWDGTQWSEFGNPNGQVLAIENVNGEIYVGGNFSTIGGIPANGVARWDGGAWSALGDGAENGVSGTVAGIVAWDNRIYVGGCFSEAGGIPANNIASWSPSGWQVLAGKDDKNDGVPRPSCPVVTSMVASPDGVFVSGQFTEAGDTPASRIAFWNGNEWSALISNNLNGFASGQAQAMQFVENDLYLAGTFGSAGGVTLRNVARWDGSQWNSIGLGAENGTDGFLQALAVSNGEIFIGGGSFFYTAGTTTVNRVARWNGTEWRAMGGTNQGIGGQVNAVVEYAGGIVIGGEFGMAGDVPARHIAYWDGQSWQALGNDAFSFRVNELAVWNDQLYAVGAFRRIGSDLVERVARWDGNSWHGIGAGFNQEINTVFVDDNNLCVGGSAFIQSDGVSMKGIACWDGSVWQPVGDGISNSSVSALTSWNEQLVAAGGFTMAGGEPANRIASWDGSQWQPLGTPPADGLNSTVHALSATDETLIAGGFFWQAGGQPIARIAAWNGTEWSQPAETLNSTVWALSRNTIGLIAGGDFSQQLNPPTPLAGVGLWDGNNWLPFGSAAQQGVSGSVRALHANNRRVLIGGQFSTAGGQLSSGFAIFNLDELPLFADRFEQ